jgi:hypothetical protein
MNGCQFIFNPSAKSAEIGPPGCGPMTVPDGCGTLSIAAQGGLSATFSGYQFAEGIISADGVEISGEVTTSPAWCRSSVKIVASWDFATQMTVWENFVPIGISLTNEKYPLTKAQAFPVNVAAGPAVLETGVMLVDKLGNKTLNVRCPAVNLSAGELTKEAKSAFSLSGTYAGYYTEGAYCESQIASVKVSMNSCRYDFPEIEQTGSTYTAVGGGITCTKEGDRIVIERPGQQPCIIRLLPQSLSATLTNEGSGLGSEIPLTIATSSLKYTTSFACQLEGFKKEGEDGVMNQKLGLRGTLPG